MVLGLISDVHANVIALDAALAALRSQGATTVVCLGDMVGYGPAPNETVERLREERILCTLGAADERIAFDFDRRAPPRKGVGDATIEWTRDVLEEVHVAWLRELPVQRKIDTPFGRLRAFHGTLDDPSARTDLQVDPASLAKLFDRHRCRILAAGATH
ncbi:MAG: metallophosphoesterase family protein, partial [Trueperaceae bacterium]